MVVRDKASEAAIVSALAELQSAMRRGDFHVREDDLCGLNGHATLGRVPDENLHYWRDQIAEAVYLASANVDEFDEDARRDWLRRRNLFFKRQAVSPFSRGHEESVMRQLNGITLH